MFKNRYIILFALLFACCVFIVISCKKSTGKKSSKHLKATSFDPNFFRSDSSYHYALKLLAVNGTYSLLNNKILKLPGRKKIKSSGDFKILYLDAGNNPIDSLLTMPPEIFIKEKKASNDSTQNFLSVDSVVFLLPLPKNNSIRFISMQYKSLSASQITVPNDTLDIIQLNATAALDSSVYQ